MAFFSLECENEEGRDIKIYMDICLGRSYTKTPNFSSIYVIDGFSLMFFSPIENALWGMVSYYFPMEEFVENCLAFDRRKWGSEMSYWQEKVFTAVHTVSHIEKDEILKDILYELVGARYFRSRINILDNSFKFRLGLDLGKLYYFSAFSSPFYSHLSHVCF